MYLIDVLGKLAATPGTFWDAKRFRAWLLAWHVPASCIMIDLSAGDGMPGRQVEIGGPVGPSSSGHVLIHVGIFGLGRRAEGDSFIRGADGFANLAPLLAADLDAVAPQ